MKYIVSRLLPAVVLFGCGEAELGPTSLDIDGGWSYLETISQDQTDGNCTFLGTLSFTQEGAIFTGSFTRTVTCSSSFGAAGGTTTSGRIHDGKIRDDTIEFRIGDCGYRGVVADANRLSGSVLCSVVNVDATVTVTTGSWQADRLTDR